MEAYSLFEVNQYIKRVIALNFEEAIWIECEISQMSLSRNNRYLELIEKDPDTDEIRAKASATLWYRQYLFVSKKLGKLTDELLAAGNKVKIKASVEFSERYGLSLNLVDIDPSYTFGQFELDRQQIIERLNKEDLIERNRALDLGLAIKNIAIISSQTAAGYKDFMDQISSNAYGYGFNLDLYASAMQGQNTEAEVLMALDEIDEDYYDVICIIRGGGSKLDLSAFDNYEISKRIAHARIPVLTGIGHEIDQSVVDIVAHTSLKTPTAVANFIIDHNLDFETELDNVLYEISNEVQYVLNEKQQVLASFQSALQTIPKYLLNEKQLELDSMMKLSKQLATSQIRSKLNSVESSEKMLELLDPSNVLKRGYTLVSHNGKYLTRRSQINKGEQKLNIEFQDGTINVKTD